MLPEDATLEMKFSLNLFFPYEEKKSYQWTLTMRMSYILVFFQDSGTTKKAKQKPPCMTNFSSQSWYPWEVGQASLVVNLVLCIQNYQQESHPSLQATRCDSTMRMRVSQAKKYWVQTQTSSPGRQRGYCQNSRGTSKRAEEFVLEQQLQDCLKEAEPSQHVRENEAMQPGIQMGSEEHQRVLTKSPPFRKQRCAYVLGSCDINAEAIINNITKWRQHNYIICINKENLFTLQSFCAQIIFLVKWALLTVTIDRALMSHNKNVNNARLQDINIACCTRNFKWRD